MAGTVIEKQIQNLRKQITQNDYLYYVLNQPKISDYEYDQLLKKLQNLENAYPQFIIPDSPTQRVSGEVAKGFRPVKHSKPMLSLSNTYSSDELREWEKRIKKLIGDNDYEFIVEPKIDGVSCTLVYEKGVFILGATRGDGITGENITLNIKTVRSIPLSLISSTRGARLPAVFEVRGEIYIEKKEFDRINNELLKKGAALFANPRNAAAGSLRQKNPKVTSTRPLNFFAHSYGNIQGGKKLDTHWNFLQLCRSLGIRSIENTKLCETIDEAIEYCMKWQENRDKLPYEIDGMVLKINLLEQHEVLGYTLKSPRWAIAYKFPARQSTTKIINIRVQVGRTGTITPVADLEPIKCGGVTISRATLHNFDEIRRLDVRIGDTVLIERAGEVIPKIVKVIESKRTKKEKVFRIPDKCPECKSEIVKEKEEVAYKCINPSCPVQLERGLIHFASRGAMDIEGVGDAVVEQLVKKNMVKDFADIYSLKNDDLLTLELVKEKKAQNLLNSINKSKNRSLEQLLFGFGIRHVGEKAALTLAEKFVSVDDLMKANMEYLTEINEIGPVMAESIVNFFNQPQTKKLIEKLKKASVNITSQAGKKPKKPQILAGKTFVFTGELKSLSRTEAEAKVRELGGKTSSTVSKKTDFVVIGKNPGSKYKKAKQLNIKILNGAKWCLS